MKKLYKGKSIRGNLNLMEIPHNIRDFPGIFGFGENIRYFRSI